MEYSEASTRRAHVQGEESGIWDQAFDESGAEEQCVNEGKRAEAYKARHLAVDARAETFSVDKACMSLQKRRRFIGCEVDQSYVTKTMLQLTLLIARQMMAKKSDNDENQ